MRPPNLARLAHAWVERQVNLGLLSGNGAKSARQLVLAVRQVKMEGLPLPSLSKRRRQMRAEGGSAAAAGLAFIENAANRAFYSIFGSTTVRNPRLRAQSPMRGVSPADVLELCEKLLLALLEVGELHETNKWLQSQLAWHGLTHSATASQGRSVLPSPRAPAPQLQHRATTSDLTMRI